MKRFLLIIVIATVALKIQAQEVYRDFLEEGKVWHYHYYDYFKSLDYNYSLFISGDTVINSRQYKKVCQDTKDRTVCLLRQEGRKIILSKESGESVIYDFSLDVEDLIQNDEACVSVIDTVKVGNRLFRRYQFSQYPSGTGCDYWIEGVGGTGDLLSELWTTGPTITFLSCDVNGELLLSRDDIFGQAYHASVTSPSVNLDFSPLYDTQGRSVARPAKGIYIQDGKKQVVRQ